MIRQFPLLLHTFLAFCEGNQSEFDINIPDFEKESGCFLATLQSEQKGEYHAWERHSQAVVSIWMGPLDWPHVGMFLVDWWKVE